MHLFSGVSYVCNNCWVDYGVHSIVWNKFLELLVYYGMQSICCEIPGTALFSGTEKNGQFSQPKDL
jgi:hypothetical protein